MFSEYSHLTFEAAVASVIPYIVIATCGFGLFIEESIRTNFIEDDIFDYN